MRQIFEKAAVVACMGRGPKRHRKLKVLAWIVVRLQQRPEYDDVED